MSDSQNQSDHNDVRSTQAAEIRPSFHDQNVEDQQHLSTFIDTTVNQSINSKVVIESSEHKIVSPMSQNDEQEQVQYDTNNNNSRNQTVKKAETDVNLQNGNNKSNRYVDNSQDNIQGEQSQAPLPPAISQLEFQPKQNQSSKKTKLSVEQTSSADWQKGKQDQEQQLEEEDQQTEMQTDHQGALVINAEVNMMDPAYRYSPYQEKGGTSSLVSQASAAFVPENQFQQPNTGLNEESIMESTVQEDAPSYDEQTASKIRFDDLDQQMLEIVRNEKAVKQQKFGRKVAHQQKIYQIL